MVICLVREDKYQQDIRTLSGFARRLCAPVAGVIILFINVQFPVRVRLDGASAVQISTLVPSRIFLHPHCFVWQRLGMMLRLLLSVLLLAGFVATPVSSACAQPAGLGVQKGQPPAKDAPAEGKTQGPWSIILATFRGAEQAVLAEAGVARVREEAKINDVFSEVRGGATVVAVGRFADPSSPEAVRRLDEVRKTKVGQTRPFLGAFLAPAGDVINVGARPEYNLISARKEFGARAQYTLQVGVYSREDINREPTEAELAELRRAAEEAAALLRKEGELAFYFHGPRRSMVTIGVWSDEDLPRRGTDEAPSRPENPELTALKKRFPHNLYNGAGLKQRNKLGNEQVQASQLVQIPER
jgi:hypothetical protein